MSTFLEPLKRSREDTEIIEGFEPQAKRPAKARTIDYHGFLSPLTAPLDGMENMCSSTMGELDAPLGSFGSDSDQSFYGDAVSEDMMSSSFVPTSNKSKGSEKSSSPTQFEAFVPGCGVDVACEKRARRMQKNRATAQASRERKKQYLITLERDNHEQRLRNNALTELVDKLKLELTDARKKCHELADMLDAVTQVNNQMRNVVEQDLVSSSDQSGVGISIGNRLRQRPAPLAAHSVTVPCAPPTTGCSQATRSSGSSGGRKANGAVLLAFLMLLSFSQMTFKPTDVVSDPPVKRPLSLGGRRTFSVASESTPEKPRPDDRRMWSLSKVKSDLDSDFSDMEIKVLPFENDKMRYMSVKSVSGDVVDVADSGTENSDLHSFLSDPNHPALLVIPLWVFNGLPSGLRATTLRQLSEVLSVLQLRGLISEDYHPPFRRRPNALQTAMAYETESSSQSSAPYRVDVDREVVVRGSERAVVHLQQMRPPATPPQLAASEVLSDQGGETCQGDGPLGKALNETSSLIRDQLAVQILGSKCAKRMSAGFSHHSPVRTPVMRASTSSSKVVVVPLKASESRWLGGILELPHSCSVENDQASPSVEGLQGFAAGKGEGAADRAFSWLTRIFVDGKAGVLNIDSL